MSDAVANILLQLKGETDDADTKLEKFHKSLQEVGRAHETATVDVKVEGETKLATTLKALNDLHNKTVTAKVEVQVDRSRLDKALAAVQDLGNKSITPAGFPALSRPPDKFSLLKDIPTGASDELKNVSKESDIAEGRIRTFINRVHTGFETLQQDGSRVGKAIDTMTHAGEDFVTKFGPALKTAETGLTALSKGIAGVLDSIGGSSGIIGGPTSALAKAFESLGAAGPAAFVPLLAIIPLVITLINSLLATVIALGASLISAAGGVASMAVALGAALGPAMILVIGLFKELSQVIQAVQASTKDQTARQDNLAKALLQQKSAQNQLTNATTTGNTAAVNALQQQKDAIIAVQNAYLSLQSAKLGVEDANLALERANQALLDFKKNLAAQGLTVGNLQKKTTDVVLSQGLGPQSAAPASQQRNAELEFDTLQQAKARALLGVKEAAQRVTDATNSYQKAQINATTGTLGSTAATNSATAAMRRLEAANIAVERAQLAMQHATGQDALGGLSKEGQKLVPIFKALVNALKQFQPALDPILHAIGVAAKGLLPIMKTLAPAFIDLGKIMGQSFKDIAKALESAGIVEMFKGFIADSGQLIKIITPGFIAFIKILFQIARDAMPGLLRVFTLFSNTLVKIAANPAAIKKFVDIFVHSFEAVLPAIGAFVGFLGRLVALAAPIGDSLFADIAKFFNGLLRTKPQQESFRAWIADGVKNFKLIAREAYNFFKNLGPLLHVLNAIGGAILSLFGPWDKLSTLGKGFRLIIEGIGLTFKFVFYDIGKALDVVIFAFNGWIDIFKLIAQVAGGFIKILTDGFNGVVDLIKQAVGLLPNLTGSVSIPLLGNINPLHHAEGGVTTRASLGIIGEGGPEAVIPLNDRVFGALAAALAPQINARLPKTPVGSSGGRHQTNHFAINAPPGQAPDVNHFVAAIEQRLSAIGAA